MPENVHPAAHLSPTPRKSERDRKTISYDKLNKGEGSDNENNLEWQQSLNFTGRKKSVVLEGGKRNEEVAAKVSALIDGLNAHKFALLFNPLTDTAHPGFEIFAKC